jgi:uncharacterized RmlC-like cupin family protein
MKLIPFLLLCGALASAQPPDSVKLDNEFVRVLFLTDAPRTKTPLHQHEPHRVMIYLDPMELVLRYQNGKVDHQRWRRGDVAWSPGGGLHTGENLVDHPARVVEVELKKPPSGKPFRVAARDPLKVNPKFTKVELENEHVRVLRCKYPANVREPLHEHLSENRLTIALEDVEVKVTQEGAADRTTALKAGQAAWSAGPVVHAGQTNRATELIVIELK